MSMRCHVLEVYIMVACPGLQAERPHSSASTTTSVPSFAIGIAKQARMTELQEKFETAVPNIEEKLSVEAKLRKAQREDNDALRAKLMEFAEQTRQR